MIAVLFEAKAQPAHQARYLQLAAELKPLLADIDGFIDIERFQSLTTEGKSSPSRGGGMRRLFSAGSKTCFTRPRRPEGRASIFACYRIRVAQVVREYASETGGEAHV
ncbi:Uncharacterised protein [Leclercia adecarboxylata]|uniref:ABM domain-containing protein n=1 Tax=Leclercia adecarboxylata TaxID=83655 RepID=A0A4U9HM83_9ENTR|nr:Uncharacterised protein [Leclercia adecarboxylata]